jgi:phage antirepressor YoqD-like protein
LQAKEKPNRLLNQGWAFKMFNEVIMSNLMTVGNNKMMSSKEIAKLTGKRHDHVIRDIRSMIEQIQSPNLGSEQYQIVTLPNGMTGEILIDHELSIVLGTGYSVPQRLMLVKRWKELEQAVAQPKTALQLAKEQVMLLEQIEQQQALLEQQAPKVAALDRIASSDGSQAITVVAKILGQQPKKFFAWLHEKGWIFKRTAGDSWEAFADKIKAGYLEMTTVNTGEPDNQKIRKHVKVTPKGITKLSEMLSAGGAV